MALQLIRLKVGTSKQCNNSQSTPFLDYHTTTENYDVGPGEDILKPHTVINCGPPKEVDSKPQETQPFQLPNTHGSQQQRDQYSHPQNTVDNRMQEDVESQLQKVDDSQLQKADDSQPQKADDSQLQNVPEWGTDVCAISPWSEHNRGEVTPCGKYYICQKGKLYKSYEHMNAVRRKISEARFKASVEN